MPTRARYLLVPLGALLALLALAASPACGGDDGGDGDKVIRIGAAVSESGRYAVEGLHVRQGYILWADWVNETYGGIKVGDDRYMVELILYDDGSEPEATAELVARLIEEDEVDFLLGPYSSTLTQSAIEVADARGVIMVEGSGASETLFQQGFTNLFAVLTPARDYSRSALNVFDRFGATSIVIAYADELFPKSVAEGARLWAKDFGIDILHIEPYPRGVSDVSEMIERFRDFDPDIFLAAGYYNDAVLFVRTAKELGFRPDAMLLTVGPSDPKFVEELGEDAEYVLGPTQWEASMRYRGDYFGSAADYAALFEAKWGATPTYQSASGSAAALALQIAIETAASLEPQDVRFALRAMRKDTFYGIISFDATGKNTTRQMGAIQIQDGAILVIAPAAAATADILYPAPD